MQVADKPLHYIILDVHVIYWPLCNYTNNYKPSNNLNRTQFLLYL